MISKVRYLLCFITHFLAEAVIEGYLYGIGYYEAIAQTGIEGISMAGGAEIVFYG